MRRLPAVEAISTWAAVAALCAVSCGAAPLNPPPANYSTDVLLTVGEKTFNYSGEGSCYAAATLFTFELTTSNGGILGFSVTMDVGRHAINQADTALFVQPSGLNLQPDKGTITVNHWSARDRADGELAATGPSISIRGHWGCRFESH